MKILSWNLQGVGNPWTVRALKFLVQNNSPDIFFLMETKLNRGEFGTICRSFVAFNSVISDANGRRGGLALFWNKNLDVTINDVSENHIAFTAMNNSLDTQWKGVGVYGWPEGGNKHLTCDLLKRVCADRSCPLVVFGDFNLFLYNYEKRGGRIRNQRELDDFQATIDDYGVADLGYDGHDFTWTNRRAGEHLIQARLDRFFANAKWQETFVDWTVYHLVRYHSDHCPILLSTKEERQQFSTRPFRFEPMWMRHESFENCVVEAWGSEGSRGHIMDRVRGCGCSMKEWAFYNIGSV
ncbi:uncharacterized protein LOC126657130 [Mercurialis annua]|uniref:uncharacterized protein LOC126657130 n=1 Tax=Mercurialis annua TaxID=3986 RepID=UPI00215E953D|nr:uncharacterized protein LOC126657130 [Mercurialis annua]